MITISRSKSTVEEISAAVALEVAGWKAIPRTMDGHQVIEWHRPWIGGSINGTHELAGSPGFAIDANMLFDLLSRCTHVAFVSFARNGEGWIGSVQRTRAPEMEFFENHPHAPAAVCLALLTALTDTTILP